VAAGGRRFKNWIKEDMTAFPNVGLKTVPGMDPVRTVVVVVVVAAAAAAVISMSVSRCLS
jgi:hypothetical protein